MIRASLLQWRTALVTAIVGLATMSIVAALTGPGIAHLYDTTLGSCRPDGTGCSTALSVFNAHDQTIRTAVQAVLLGMPVVVGMFWGAPLVAREFESGTYRLAWTQGRSRYQWFAAKIGVAGLTVLLVQGITSFTLTWWWAPVDNANHHRFSLWEFSAFGITPIGYAAFALALGIAVGTVVRRTVPAMALTLAGYVGARLAITYWVRPHYISPATSVLPLPGSSAVGLSSQARGQMSLNFFPPDLPGGWLLSSGVSNAAGQAPSGDVLSQHCPPLLQAQVGYGDLGSALTSCVANLSHSFHQTITYQPATRYWTFQWIECGLFVALAIGMTLFTFWWLDRRLG